MNVGSNWLPLKISKIEYNPSLLKLFAKFWPLNNIALELLSFCIPFESQYSLNSSIIFLISCSSLYVLNWGFISKRLFSLFETKLVWENFEIKSQIDRDFYTISYIIRLINKAIS